MEDKSGMGWAGLLLFFVVIWILFSGGIGGFGNRGVGGCISNCEVEKQGIIDSARTQYLVETTSRQTQEYLGNKIDFYEYQNLRDQLAVERSKNLALEGRIYSDAQFNALGNRLDAIECSMLKRPSLYGLAATCTGQIIPPITTTATTA